MPRATALLAATTAVLVSLGALTACQPDGSSDPGTGTQPPSSTAARPSATATATGGGHASSGVPDSAWMNPHDIPLDEAYHWPSPATAAKSASTPKFQFESLCKSKRSSDLDGATDGAHAAQALLGSGGSEDWKAQETLVNWAGTNSGPIQTAGALFRGMADEVKACKTSVAGATVKVAAEDSTYLAATISIPQPGGAALTLHEYLVNDRGTVAELALWSAPAAGSKPKTAWPAAYDDTAALKTLQAPLCTAFQDC